MALNKFQTSALELAAGQVEKWLRLSRHPDYENAVGPLDPKQIIALLDFSRNYFPPPQPSAGVDGSPKDSTGLAGCPGSRRRSADVEALATKTLT